MKHQFGMTGFAGYRGAAGAAVLCALALSLSGCTMGTLSLSGPDTSAVAVSGLRGKIIGGQQPVAGSAVKLYQVGTTGYGTGATAITGATTYTDINGNFSIPSYTCPNGNALTYLVATGGNPGNGNLFNISSIAVTGTSGAYVDTFTAANSYAPGNTVVLTGITNSSFTYLNGTTQTITAVASDNSTFSIADTSSSNPGTGIYPTSGLASASGSVNTAIRMVAAIGSCSAASSKSVNINEVATAAAAYALAQYVDPATGLIGSPGTTQAATGLANAFALVPLLVNSQGIAVTSTSLTGAGATLLAVPESDRLYTIANILAACVNSSGNSGATSSCGILFANAGAATATDTFDAAVEMARMPFNTAIQVSALYGLQSARTPFTGTSLQPNDWTLGIQYQDNVGTFFIKPQNIAVDALGNVWVLSNNAGPSGLVEVSPTGTPLSVVSSLSEYGPFQSPIANPPVLSSPKTSTTTIATQNTLVTSTFGGVSSNPSINARNLAIDPSGNVWFTESSGANGTNGGSNGSTTIPISGNVFVVPTSAGLPTGSSFGFATGKSGYSLAIDTAGDAFMGEQSSTAYFGTFEFPYNSTAGNALLIPAAFPPNASAVSEYMAIDKSGNLWYTNGTSAVSKLSGANASSCSNTTATPSLCQPTGTAYVAITDSTNAFSTTTAPYGIAEGTTGMWIANSGTGTGGNTLVSVPFAATAGTAYGDATYLTAPKLPAVDGAGNVWVSNSTGPNITTNTTGGSVSVANASGTFLSPSNGGSTTIGPGYNHLGLSFGAGTAIDPSGNVWVANNAAFAAACSFPLTTPAVGTSSGGNTCSSIFELVGSAVPVVTPIASQQSSGPSKP